MYLNVSNQTLKCVIVGFVEPDYNKIFILMIGQIWQIFMWKIYLFKTVFKGNHLDFVEQENKAESGINPKHEDVIVHYWEYEFY